MIDLHTHSTVSDGTMTPCELLHYAKECGLEAIALTDHDTCGGLLEAENAAKELDIPFVRGCEVSTRSELGEFHILGLWLPHNVDTLEECFATLRQRRMDRNARIVEKLCQLGFPLTIEEVKKCAGDGSVGRPHIAQVLVQKGYVRDERVAFHEYLGEGCKAYVAKEVFRPEEAVKLLVHEGATCILAHPMLHHYPLDWLKNKIKSLVDLGLDGIEVWHSDHSPQDTKICLSWAKEMDLMMSGGSDFHGERKPNVQLGFGRNNLSIPKSVYETLCQRRKAKNLPLS